MHGSQRAQSAAWASVLLGLMTLHLEKTLEHGEHSKVAHTLRRLRVFKGANRKGYLPCTIASNFDMITGNTSILRDALVACGRGSAFRSDQAKQNQLHYIELAGSNSKVPQILCSALRPCYLAFSSLLIIYSIDILSIRFMQWPHTSIRLSTKASKRYES